MEQDTKELIKRTIPVALLIIIVCVMGYNQEVATKRVDVLTAGYNIVRDDVDNIITASKKTDTQIWYSSTGLADLWLQRLNETALETLKTWEQGPGKDFFRCNNESLEAIRTARTYYSTTQEFHPGKYLVLEYATTDVTYRDDGVVQCFTKPIMVLDPTPYDCREVCEEVTA